MNENGIQSIDKIFNRYIELLCDENLCSSNQLELTNSAYMIDAYALTTIINYFNSSVENKKNVHLWRSNLLAIRMFSLFSAELLKYLEDTGLINSKEFQQPNFLIDVFELRDKIHQFRHMDFDVKISLIDTLMGRSRNQFAPRIDICLQYY